MGKPKHKIDLSLLVMKITFIVFVFLLGSLAAMSNSQPFSYFQQGYRTTVLFAMESLQTRSFLLSRKRYPGEGVVKKSAEAYDGVTVVQGIFPGGPQLKLVDMSGNELHRWVVDFDAVWPAPEHIPDNKIPKNRFHYHTQGMVVEPDGSVLVNVGDNGAVKLDKCGHILWSVDRMTHHAITPGRGGGYWFPANRRVDSIPETLLFSRVSRERLKTMPATVHHGYENLVLYVDDEGKVKKAFSVLQAVYEGGLERQLHDALEIDSTDPTHVNDIEIVTSALADKIDGVSAGDLLVSIRQMHMLAILDQENGAIKWRYVGPWIRQHDPDITPAGTIIVFNNGSTTLNRHRPAGSNLIELDPATGETTIIYPTKNEDSFYTDIMGMHQALPDGNRLIVESRAGRVFEIDRQGNVVWDYRAVYDEEYSSLVEAAARFPADYFSVENWACD